MALIMYAAAGLVIIGTFLTWDTSWYIRGIKRSFGIATLVMGIIAIIAISLGKLSENEKMDSVMQVFLILLAVGISGICIMLAAVAIDPDDWGVGLIMTAVGGVLLGLGAIWKIGQGHRF